MITFSKEKRFMIIEEDFMLLVLNHIDVEGYKVYKRLSKLSETMKQLVETNDALEETLGE